MASTFATPRPSTQHGLPTLSSGLTAHVDARRRNFDAVLVLNTPIGFFLPLLERRGAPTVVNVDGFEWQRAKWSALGKLVFRAGAHQVAESASSVVADSQCIANYCLSHFGRHASFIPYGGTGGEEIPAEEVLKLVFAPRIRLSRRTTGAR